MLIYGKALDNGASVSRQSSLHCCRAIALADKSRQRSEKMFGFIETVLIQRISFSFSLPILFSTTFKLLIHTVILKIMTSYIHTLPLKCKKYQWEKHLFRVFTLRAGLFWTFLTDWIYCSWMFTFCGCWNCLPCYSFAVYILFSPCCVADQIDLHFLSYREERRLFKAECFTNWRGMNPWASCLSFVC